MQKKFLLLATSALLAACSAQPSTTLVDEISGLWQFPGRGVWIQINSDGSAFQCRVAQGGNLITSKGRFSGPSSIVWEQAWGTDLVHAVAGGIRLRGQYGEFTFNEATDPMSEDCVEAQVAG